MILAPLTVACLVVFPPGYPRPYANVLVLMGDGTVLEGQVSSWDPPNKAFWVHSPKAWEESSATIRKVRCVDRGKTWAYNRECEAQAFRTVVALMEVKEPS